MGNCALLVLWVVSKTSTEALASLSIDKQVDMLDFTKHSEYALTTN